MSTSSSFAGMRPATHADIDEMTRILAAAFLDDPVWGPAFPNRETRPQVAGSYWRFIVREALRFPESQVFAHESAGRPGALRAVSVWYPPGEDEISVEALPKYDELVRDLLDDESAAALEQAGLQFAAARPSAPHAYLTLLGVAPESRGGGYGMQLLEGALARYDKAGIPTYLESSNPVNDRRYERLGYRPHTVVELLNGARVQTYWRDPSESDTNDANAAATIF